MNLLVIGEPKSDQETALVLSSIMQCHDVKNIILVENFGLLCEKVKNHTISFRDVNYIKVSTSVPSEGFAPFEREYKKAIELVAGGIIVVFPPLTSANLFMQLLEAHGTGGEKIVKFFDRDFGPDHHYSKD